jgi:hypothetical protein
MRHVLLGGPSVPTNDTETFIAIARQQIVHARIRLASGSLTSAEEADLWHVVDGIEAIIKMRARSFEAELEQIDRELEQHFRR